MQHLSFLGRCNNSLSPFLQRAKSSSPNLKERWISMNLNIPHALLSGVSTYGHFFVILRTVVISWCYVINNSRLPSRIIKAQVRNSCGVITSWGGWWLILFILVCFCFILHILRVPKVEDGSLPPCTPISSLVQFSSFANFILCIFRWGNNCPRSAKYNICLFQQSY